MMEWICSQFGLLWGKAVPSKVCYHVAPSGAGGKGVGGGGVMRLGGESGDGEMERDCGVETGGELNSSSKPQNAAVSRERAREELWCRQSAGSFDVVCAGVYGPWRVDSHSTHEFESERSRQCRAYWRRQGEHCNQLLSSCEEGVQNHMKQMESTQRGLQRQCTRMSLC